MLYVHLNFSDGQFFGNLSFLDKLGKVFGEQHLLELFLFETFLDDLFFDPHDLFVEDLFVLVEFFGTDKIELFFDFIVAQDKVELFGLLLLS